jgi:hypothetical protein
LTIISINSIILGALYDIASLRWKKGKCVRLQQLNIQGWLNFTWLHSKRGRWPGEGNLLASRQRAYEGSILRWIINTEREEVMRKWNFCWHVKLSIKSSCFTRFLFSCCKKRASSDGRGSEWFNSGNFNVLPVCGGLNEATIVKSSRDKVSFFRLNNKIPRSKSNSLKVNYMYSLLIKRKNVFTWWDATHSMPTKQALTASPTFMVPLSRILFIQVIHLFIYLQRWWKQLCRELFSLSRHW